MAEKNGDSNEPNEQSARLTTSPEDQAKAKKWFSRARELGEKRQFDYAIEYYVNGLEFWPDAVEEACKPLHGCAVARRQTGGKKPGLRDTMKRSMTDKDARKAYVNALWLFGQDPENFSFIEGIARAASRLRAEDAAKWASGVAIRSLETVQKPSSKQFQSLLKLIEELGDRAADRGEHAFAVETYQMGVDVLNTWRRRIPKEQSIDKVLKDLSTKLTILKGKYRGDWFRDSMAEGDQQREIHDQERTVQSDERLDELIAVAERDFEANPESNDKLIKLVELLRRRENEKDEIKAIGYLVEHYKSTDDYRWKKLADDIRMKQLARATRSAVKAGDMEAAKEEQIKQLRFELGVFKERVERYPTDNRIRFEYGVRCFKAGRFDEAIPLLQAARSDPKTRNACGLYLGRCFYRKGYYQQAINAFEESISHHEFTDDDLGKDLHYWLGRAQEKSGKIEDARRTYGQILQMDYNYRDVRDRIDGLPAAGE